MFGIMLFVGTVVGGGAMIIKWITTPPTPEQQAASEARRRAQPYEGGCIHNLGSECLECRWGEERRRTEVGYPPDFDSSDAAWESGDMESPLGIFG
jgi:hypothetical protein